MTTIKPVITVHIEPMRKFKAIVQAGLGGGSGGGKGTSAAGGGSNPFEDWRKQAEKRYSTFITQRFSSFSRGGGDWPALALSTIRARSEPARGRAGKGGGSGGGIGARSSLGRVTTAAAKAKYGPLGLLKAAGRTVSILVDTSMLMKAVGMNGVGHRSTRLPNGVQYGFNDTPHPGGVTIGQLASYHHFGKGHNPKRPILVEPSPAVVQGMRNDLSLAVRKAIQISKSGGGK